MISEIQIERFKSIENIALSLDKINVLLGPNNSGKSSVLQAIQFAVSICQTTGNLATASWRNNRLAATISPQQLVYSPVADVYALGHKARLKEKAEDAIGIRFIDSEEQLQVQVRKGRNKNIAVSLDGESLGTKVQDIKKPYSIIVPGLAGVGATESYVTPSIIYRCAARGDSNSVFRNILLELENQVEDGWAKFSSTFSSIYPDHQIKLKFDPRVDEHISCLIEANGQLFPIDACGTGMQQIIQILSYIYLFHPRLLILDEPDAHLHPNNQRLLVETIKTLIDRLDIQVLISTHSKYMVESLTQQSIAFWLDNGKLVEKSNDNDDRYIIKSLLDIGALDRSEVANDRIQVLCEDQCFDLLKLICASSGWDLDEVDFWPYNGCSNHQVASALIKYIRNKSPNVIVLLHRDRDYLTDEELADWKNRLPEDENLFVYITEGNDLEHLLLSKEHLSQVVSESNIDLDELLSSSLESCKDKQLEKIVNTRIDALRKIKGNINEGSVAVECSSKLGNDGIQYAHGKTLLKSLRNEYRTRTRQNLEVMKETQALSIDMFCEIWTKQLDEEAR